MISLSTPATQSTSSGSRAWTSWLFLCRNHASDQSARRAQLLDRRDEQVVGVLVRRVEGEPIDDVAEPLQERGSELVRFGDHGEGVQHVVVDELAHLPPAGVVGAAR